MLGNTCGWVVYSFLLQNFFIFFANAPGFVLSVWLNMQAVKLQYENFRTSEMKRSIVHALEESSSPLTLPGDTQTTTQSHSTYLDYANIVWNVTALKIKAPAPHERLVMGMVLVWMSVISLIAFADDAFSSRVRELIVGITVNLNLVFFYGAPLSTIFTVLKTRSSATIHIPTMITNTANGSFWCAYGIAVLDPFIYVSNGLGALLGVIQIILRLIFPNRETQETPNTASDQEMTTTAAEDVEKALDKVVHQTGLSTTNGLEMRQLNEQRTSNDPDKFVER